MLTRQERAAMTIRAVLCAKTFLSLLIGRDVKRRKHQLDWPGLHILCPSSREEVQVEVRWEQGGADEADVKQVNRKQKGTTRHQEPELQNKTPPCVDSKLV